VTPLIEQKRNKRIFLEISESLFRNALIFPNLKSPYLLNCIINYILFKVLLLQENCQLVQQEKGAADHSSILNSSTS